MREYHDDAQSQARCSGDFTGGVDGGSGPTIAQDGYVYGDADSGAMLADLVFVRPLSLVGTVLGGVIFVVTLPFTLPSRSTEVAATALVAEPFEYTFNRPLGDFDHCGDTRHLCGG